MDFRDTKGGQQFSNRHSDVYRLWKFNFDQTNETHKTNFVAWLQNNYLGHLPFYWDPEGDGTLYLVRLLAAELGYQTARYQVYDTDEIVLKQEL